MNEKVYIIRRYLLSQHKEAYVISCYETLCHDMSYVITIAASLTYSMRLHTLSILFHNIHYSQYMYWLNSEAKVHMLGHG